MKMQTISASRLSCFLGAVVLSAGLGATLLADVEVTSTNLVAVSSAKTFRNTSGELLPAGSTVRIGFFPDPDGQATRDAIDSGDYTEVAALFLPVGEGIAGGEEGTGGPLQITDVAFAGGYGGTVTGVRTAYLAPGTKLFLWVFNHDTPAQATEWGLFHDPSWLAPNKLGSINLATIELDAATEAWRGSIDLGDGAMVLAPNTANNRSPVAVADELTMVEDGSVLIDVLDNDSDPDGDPVLLSGIAHTPDHGSAAIEGTKIRYTPGPDFNGPDSFAYRIHDGKGGTAEGAVSIDVEPENDPPLANPDTATAVEDGRVRISVLGNDTDIDGDELSLDSISAQPASGTAIASGRVITYTPGPNFHGSVSIGYVVSDGNGGTAESTVAVTVTPVNDEPVAVADGGQMLEDTTGLFDVLSNDSDADGDELTLARIVAPPSVGSAELAENRIRYTPPAGFNGIVQLTYEVSDGNGGSSSAVLTIDVGGVNDEPVAENDSATTDEDTAVTIAVLLNDRDLDGDDLSVSRISASAARGTAVITGNSVVYTPEEHFHGNDQFSYEISDGNGGTATATVSVTIRPVDDPVEAVADAAELDEDASVLIDVTANDIDPDQGEVEVTAITVAPKSGSATIVQGGIRYEPEEHFFGDDSFTYEVEDDTGNGATATVSVKVNSVNDEPIAVADTASGIQGEALTIDVLPNDTDVDGDSLTVVSIVESPKNGAAVIEAGKIRYTPDGEFSGSDSFLYEVGDGNGGSAQARVSVTIESTALPEVAIASFGRAGPAEGELAVTVDQSGPWVFELQQSPDLRVDGWENLEAATASSEDGLRWTLNFPLRSDLRVNYFRVLVKRR